MKAIILAAGRGSRMLSRTQNCPKCLLELAGKPLLQWQMESLQTAGFDDILVVRGYLGHTLSPQLLPWAQNFSVADNPDWARSNMLRTLLCAGDFVRKAFSDGTSKIVVSYADIVYHPDHVRSLIACPADISLTYDTLWEPLWRLRFGNPLLDAETFRQEGGYLQEIGNKPQCLADVQGQYMGLISFTKHGWQIIESACTALGDRLNATDMTSFLRGLLTQGANIGTVPVQGRWCEADNEEDLQRYEHSLTHAPWPHDWRKI